MRSAFPAKKFRYHKQEYIVYMANKPEKDPEQFADEIVDSLVRIMNKAAAIEQHPLDIGHGVLLHASEVHLIDVAGRYPDEGVSQIASRLGITKGAVSQTAKRLEQKGYLEKVRREGNRKTVFLGLTERGREAFAWHKVYHEITNRQITGHLMGMNRRDIQNIKNLFLAIEVMFDSCPDVRAEVTRKLQDGHPNVQ
jgi:DNA-binding MarR family transcriptional regulator